MDESTVANVRKRLRKEKEKDRNQVRSNELKASGRGYGVKHLVYPRQKGKKRPTDLEGNSSKVTVAEELDDHALPAVTAGDQANGPMQDLLPEEPVVHPYDFTTNLQLQQKVEEFQICAGIGPADDSQQLIGNIEEEESEWTRRLEKVEGGFKGKRKDHETSSVESFSLAGDRKCQLCLNLVAEFIKCQTCCLFYCAQCDQSIHKHLIFHNRLGKHRHDRNGNSSSFFRQHEFLSLTGWIIKIDVFVPCFPPVTCPGCQCSNTLVTNAGKTDVAVIVSDGRYDLKVACFTCSNEDCETAFEATSDHYISSGFWPGCVDNITYLFCAKVLRTWHHIKHKTPGTSERKFLATLEALSEENGRCGVINPTLFDMASREFDFHCHQVDSQIKLRDKLTCDACGDRPLVSHCDGNMKLYRLESAKDRGAVSLYEDLVIADDSRVDDYVEQINKEIPQVKGHDTCGSSTFKAGQSAASSNHKGLDETGLLCQCCRHGVVLRCANLKKGENYRVVHYMHNFAFEKNVRFFCYDIVCRYWDFAKKVGESFPQCKDMTENMRPFLSRFHGKAHGWDCQAIWSGHHQEGPAGTLGEEQEQVNAKLSLYGCTTKHMSKAHRNERLSSGILEWNWNKNGMMHRTLPDRLRNAHKKVAKYSKELETLLALHKVDYEDLPGIKERLVSQARLHKDKRLNSEWSLLTLQRELEGVCLVTKILKEREAKFADGCKARTVFRRKMGQLKERSLKLMALINEKCDPMERVTEEHRKQGIFPWNKHGKGSVAVDFKIVDAWQLMLRFKEEIVQTRDEMVTFLERLCDRRRRLQADIDQLISAENMTDFDQGVVFLKKEEIKLIDSMGRQAIKAFDVDLSIEPTREHIADEEEEDSVMDSLFWNDGDEFGGAEEGNFL